ncbi:MAG: GlcNAc-PI de-N-acetylase [candidate division BRC1 bacterium ADurb.BinA292]|nr:MAG: GlcNAc-PI de-N-acetylase [candidate division BRC1 bacterium ADurb.BinA292]
MNPPGEPCDRPRVLACVAHPDDVEFVMAGTLILLAEAGYEPHVMNIADGSLGSTSAGAEETAGRRLAEARAAAESIGAIHHPPIARDLELFYCDRLLRRLAAVVRRINPTIVLVQAPFDYMEDHMNASRLAVSATFSKGMPNYRTDPPVDAAGGPCAVCHAMPHGLRDPLRRRVEPEFLVDITRCIGRKAEMLACHHSQREFLTQSQAMDSFVETMRAMAAELANRYGLAGYAEGWRRRLHLGFGEEDFDPLRDALGESIYECEPNDSGKEQGDGSSDE